MIKVTTKEKSKSEQLDFPKLMISKNDGEIILATGDTVLSIAGTCIFDPSGRHESGFMSRNWTASAFSDYTGEITIKNEFI